MVKKIGRETLSHEYVTSGKLGNLMRCQGRTLDKRMGLGSLLVSTRNGNLSIKPTPFGHGSLRIEETYNL